MAKPSGPRCRNGPECGPWRIPDPRPCQGGVRARTDTARGGAHDQAQGQRADLGQDPPARSAQAEHDPAGAEFGTDKWGLHRYAQHYDGTSQHLRNGQFSLLEIGIGGYSREPAAATSLRMWKAYFPKAQIVGLDIEDKSFVNEDRILAYQGSQIDAAGAQARSSARTASSRSSSTTAATGPNTSAKTFAILFPLLAKGGIYAIEDTQTSYWPRFGGSTDLDDKTTTMALVKDLLDGLNHKEFGTRSPARTPTSMSSRCTATTIW